MQSRQAYLFSPLINPPLYYSAVAAAAGFPLHAGLKTAFSSLLHHQQQQQQLLPLMPPMPPLAHPPQPPQFPLVAPRPPAASATVATLGPEGATSPRPPPEPPLLRPPPSSEEQVARAQTSAFSTVKRRSVSPIVESAEGVDEAKKSRKEEEREKEAERDGGGRKGEHGDGDGECLDLENEQPRKDSISEEMASPYEVRSTSPAKRSTTPSSPPPPHQRVTSPSAAMPSRNVTTPPPPPPALTAAPATYFAAAAAFQRSRGGIVTNGNQSPVGLSPHHPHQLFSPPSSSRCVPIWLVVNESKLSPRSKELLELVDLHFD